ncbi:MAG: helix-turn-helix domain-containing protein [Chitinophagaceae bacterium]|nr:helix-turn-helix domain-containing protein [Chitinophagaceae bacterium]
MLQALKPSFKQIFFNPGSSFHLKVDKGHNLYRGMHYHPEIELVLVRHSRGSRVIGKSVESFEDNDLVLIGSNTPHGFLHDEEMLAEGNPAPEALVVQFGENFLGREFLKLPELKEVYELLVTSRNGICITEEGKANIIPLMERMFGASSLDAIIILLEILKRLTSKSICRELISSNRSNNDPGPYCMNDHRFNEVLNYTYSNFDEHITIEKVARIANLTRESFCRYFKTLANKTYIEFLTEYRISKACQMISHGEKPVKEIGYTCGFDSLSNFYYQFKRITKLSPLEFSRRCTETAKSKEMA